MLILVFVVSILYLFLAFAHPNPKRYRSDVNAFMEKIKPLCERDIHAVAKDISAWDDRPKKSHHPALYDPKASGCVAEALFKHLQEDNQILNACHLGYLKLLPLFSKAGRKIAMEYNDKKSYQRWLKETFNLCDATPRRVSEYGKQYFPSVLDMEKSVLINPSDLEKKIARQLANMNHNCRGQDVSGHKIAQEMTKDKGPYKAIKTSALGRGGKSANESKREEDEAEEITQKQKTLRSVDSIEQVAHNTRPNLTSSIIQPRQLNGVAEDEKNVEIGLKLHDKASSLPTFNGDNLVDFEFIGDDVLIKSLTQREEADQENKIVEETNGQGDKGKNERLSRKKGETTKIKALAKPKPAKGRKPIQKKGKFSLRYAYDGKPIRSFSHFCVKNLMTAIKLECSMDPLPTFPKRLKDWKGQPTVAYKTYLTGKNVTKIAHALMDWAVNYEVGGITECQKHYLALYPLFANDHLREEILNHKPLGRVAGPKYKQWIKALISTMIPIIKENEQRED